MAWKSDYRRYVIKIQGTVQGVGFRPYVFNRAKNLDLKGKVFNSSEGVVIDVEGPKKRLLSFLEILKKEPPPLAKIDKVEFFEAPVINYGSFFIVASENESEKKALIPPDVAVCSECKKDIMDPSNRRYMYPFTNCTNCGPRFTIVNSVPYDRERTSMKKFKMCERCEREYHDPKDRRFHAQPICCPGCGPKIWVEDKDGKIVAFGDEWLSFVWERLKEGGIIAIKGLGGFHLSCDAKNEIAVATLRLRKRRPRKPLAVMVRDLDTVRKYCFLGEDEEKLLSSIHAPIVILKKRPDFSLPESLSPGINSLGVMLPYTPLHFLLLSGPFEILVMTSGNISELPIIIDNEEAREKLCGICDFLVLHDRDIVNRCDDSVVKILNKSSQFFRLSRGYVPEAISLPIYTPFAILAIGGEMKNNFCVVKENMAFMSQYIGEVDTEEGRNNLIYSVENFLRLLDLKIEIISCDSHPNYVSSEVAKSLPAKIYVECQHHHAHMASAMAENGIVDEVIGVILDGTGYGDDGRLWGFEILKGNYARYKRLFHLAYCPLPGGEIAIKEPWRMAVSYLYFFLKHEGLLYAERIFGKERTYLLVEIIEKGFNNPLSSGCGRLFDAVSAILGICEINTYEGQAAIELGEMVEVAKKNGEETDDHYYCEIKGDVILPTEIFRGIIRDKFSGLPVHVISIKFHNTLVEIIKKCVELAFLEFGIKKVVLSGGTFHNEYLLLRLTQILSSLGFEVYTNRKVPPNDGGIALGQAMIAIERLKEGNYVSGNMRAYS